MLKNNLLSIPDSICAGRNLRLSIIAFFLYPFRKVAAIGIPGDYTGVCPDCIESGVFRDRVVVIGKRFPVARQAPSDKHFGIINLNRRGSVIPEESPAFSKG